MSNNGTCLKCLVWDLDDTLWEGILLEGDDVRLRPQAREVVETLDRRGILQSIASRNDPEPVLTKLREFGLEEYFLYPQIHWDSKAESIRAIAQSLNIGLDAVAFIDDQPFERDQVTFSLPEVTCIEAGRLPDLLDMPIFKPACINEDSRLRRQMYLSEIARKEAERRHDGPQEAFLASLGMVLTIFPATQDDLLRAAELTVRTHQLNATGVPYSHEDLDLLRRSGRHDLLMARLEDRYGTYGHIGLALVERQPEFWTIRLLLTSCRVISRGVGSILLAHIMHQARARNVRLRAHFVPTDRNRMMQIAYRFAGFREVGVEAGVTLLEHDLIEAPAIPDHVKLVFKREGEMC